MSDHITRTAPPFSKLYKITRLFTWRAGFLGFWTILSIITDGLLIAALVLRIAGIVGDDESGNQHLKSFQVLSCVAPFIWFALVHTLLLHNSLAAILG